MFQIHSCKSTLLCVLIFGVLETRGNSNIFYWITISISRMKSSTDLIVKSRFQFHTQISKWVVTCHGMIKCSWWVSDSLSVLRSVFGPALNTSCTALFIITFVYYWDRLTSQQTITIPFQCFLFLLGFLSSTSNSEKAVEINNSFTYYKLLDSTCAPNILHVTV